ncbi:MAG: site-specific integrase [Tepidisphaeraceae bacterium]|jgi:hypothetical protein
MAHFPKPFFRSARNAWFVQVGDRQIKLAADKDEAFARYHELMAKPSLPPVNQAEAQKLVVVIVDEFLDWCEKHRAPNTYRWYKDRLNSFVATIDPSLTADQLKPHHVQKWVDNYGVPLKSGSRRNLIASIKRAMKWAEEQGYLAGRRHAGHRVIRWLGDCGITIRCRRAQFRQALPPVTG